jgi:phosphoribosylanthranilate isomerase
MAYHLRVKICGVTTPADAALVAEAGADSVGLNFYPSSPRYLDPEGALPVLDALPPRVQAVGVFVERPLTEIAALSGPLSRLGAVQWHGQHREPPEGFPLPYIPAFPVRDADSLLAVRRYLDGCRSRGRPVAAVLLDAHVAGQYGGTGRTAPWHLLADFRLGVPVILAGGLTPDNVAEAVRLVRPYAVDVASGVELAPGRKDAEKVRRFIDSARAAAAG